MSSYIQSFEDASLDVADPRLDFEPLPDRFLNILRAFFSDTYRSCSYHRQRMERAGVKPEDIRSLEDFERIPLLGPEDIGSTSEFSLLPDRYFATLKQGSLVEFSPTDRIAKKFTTTGSTGRPKVSYYTVSDWEAGAAQITRMFSQIPVKNYSRIFNCFNPGHVGGKVFEDTFNRHGCTVENKHFTLQKPEEVIRQLYNGLPDLGGFNCLLMPPCLPPGLKVGKGGTLDELLNVDVDNYIGAHIKVIITAGAPRDLPEFRLKERVWEANELAGTERSTFIELYGCAEVALACADCPEYNGLHLYQGHTYTEVVNPETGRRVKNGERGLVVFTGLKHASRFLRYMIGDEATFIADKCRCGRATTRLKDITRVMERERLRQGCAAG
jgi:phenylacetate-CoA ligase